MRKGDLLQSLFPKRWIPDDEAPSAWEEEELDEIGELLLPTRAVKLGEYELGKFPEKIYTFKDQRHMQIIEIHYHKEEIWMITYSFGAAGKPMIIESDGEIEKMLLTK